MRMESENPVRIEAQAVEPCDVLALAERALARLSTPGARENSGENPVRKWARESPENPPDGENPVRIEAPEATPGTGRRAAWAEGLNSLLGMPLADFALARLAVEVDSAVLGERVIFASENARLAPGERRPVYRAVELAALAHRRPSPDELRRIHAVKVAFGGRIALVDEDAARAERMPV